MLDTLTGEISPRLDIEKLLTAEPGGVLAGNNLYSTLAALAPDVQKDEGWTMTINLQQQRVKPMDKNEKRVTGKIYISRLTYRRAKVGGRKNRRRPPAIKWVVLELSLFLEKPPLDVHDVLAAGEALVGLAERRKISPRPSPGSFGGAMLRASPEWIKRKPAPKFVSEIAREHLPGNYYAVSSILQHKRLPHAYYLDQESSHHKIAASIPLPHPHTLRARGFLRSVENGVFPRWTDDPYQLRAHIGVFCCVVECSTLPAKLAHLYPPWAKERGKHMRWIWSPEMRLFKDDHRVQLSHISASLTSRHIDTALCEYAEWALTQREREDKNIIKSSLLAAYGMLACRSDRPIDIYSVHGRGKPPRATVVELPLLPEVYKSEVRIVRTPTVQNVVARGVIEAETRTRSLEYARQLEGEGIQVAQIYADGLLAATDTLPMLLPEHWRIAASLTRVSAPHPNAIISDQLVRLPGILGSSQEAYLKNFPAGRLREGFESRIVHPSSSI